MRQCRPTGGQVRASGSRPWEAKLMQEPDELTQRQDAGGGAVVAPAKPGSGNGADAGAAPGLQQSALPTGSRATWILVVCCVAQFMVILDLSIVNVALPSTQSSLNFSSAALQWVVDA